ncbi:hypothetical protein RchiOBHm_Chr6g0266961 [Rosa chinensis]|uniref:Uncharacterized protein n=1 Tax=Rosa chinensis TaxID=74649 RepID=A0A2P6PPU3_ROSCH|nr:hypothetical protein RchiOBHm_Chr6g0266961 [Rosa chinensis]
MPGLAVYSAAVEYVVVGGAFCQRRWLAEEARVSGEKVQRRRSSEEEKLSGGAER